MPSARRTRTFPIMSRSWVWDWLWKLMYHLRIPIPFLGKKIRSGHFYDFYINGKSNRKYLQDTKTGAVCRLE